MSQKRFEKLVELMTRLRSKNGCPWDKAQTFSSIKKHLIEEAYEVCDTIDSKNHEKLKEELGDLLFQVIFYSQIARDRGLFDINDVLRASYKKMIRRHPHVFGRHKAKTPDDAYKHWQRKKDEENNYKEEKTLLKGIPKTLPALLKAQKVSKRASWLGFDWPDIKGIFEKIGEELDEIKSVRDKRNFEEEFGDLLFSVVNLARFRGIDAEDALNSATKKFVRRFKRIEEKLEKQGKSINECSLKELDRLWNLHK